MERPPLGRSQMGCHFLETKMMDNGLGEPFFEKHGDDSDSVSPLIWIPCVLWGYGVFKFVTFLIEATIQT